MRFPGAMATLAILLCHSAGVASQAADNARGAQHHFEEGEKAIAENRLEAASQAYEKLAQINPKCTRSPRQIRPALLYAESLHRGAVPQLRDYPAAKTGIARRRNSIGHLLRGVEPF